MKKWLKFAAVIMVGALIFTACEKDVTLSVPGEAVIDLGDEFDPLAGVTVDGAKVEDVQVLWNPAWSNVLVNHYVATYQIEGETAQRDVYVRADKLARSYAVTEVDNAGTYGPYPVIVTTGNAFNELRFNELFFDDIIVNATIDGEAMTIPTQSFFGGDVIINGTGTYNGSTQRVLSIDYTIDYFGEDIVGTATFN